MKDTLRLITTYSCPRKCEGCCNNQPDYVQDMVKSVKLIALPGLLEAYDKIVITGGEPTLFLTNLDVLCKIIDFAGCTDKILYTANSDYTYDIWLGFLHTFNGVTLSIHTQKDFEQFYRLHIMIDENPELKYFMKPLHFNNYRLRIMNSVKIRKGSKLMSSIKRYWNVTTGLEYLDDCPVPQNEDLYRLAELW